MIRLIPCVIPTFYQVRNKRSGILLHFAGPVFQDRDFVRLDQSAIFQERDKFFASSQRFSHSSDPTIGRLWDDVAVFTVHYVRTLYGTSFLAVGSLNQKATSHVVCVNWWP